MIRNYTYRLYSSKHHKALSSLITTANHTWNHIVALCHRYYRRYGKSVSEGQLKRHMAKMAKRDRYMSKLHSQSLQAICERYEDALKQAFKIKGRGLPHARRMFGKGSVLFKGNGGYVLEAVGNKGVLRINKLGKNWKFRFKLTRQWGEVRNITVKRDEDGYYYLTVCCNVPDERLEREGYASIGIDFGMKTFLTLSDGTAVQIPDYHRKALAELKTADRSLSYKRNAKVYGTTYRRAKHHRQVAYAKVANRRSDFHWKLAHELCKKYSFIAIEDLNMKSMQMHRNWGRKVSSLGYSEFVLKLMVVAEKYGTVIHKIDRWYASSQTCNVCGYVYKGTKDLKVREWTCPVCDTVHDRDVNAAINIVNVALNDISGKGVSRVGSNGKTPKGQPSEAVAHGSCDPATDQESHAL